MVVHRRALGRTAAAVAVVSVVMLLTSATAYGAQPLGALTQLPGTAGCFTHDGSSEDGANTCGKARGMAETESAIVSPDGASVYVGSYENGAASLGRALRSSRATSRPARSAAPGDGRRLTADGSSNAGAGTCTKARGIFDSMGDGHDLVFTSNGHLAYMAANGFGSNSGILIFNRDPSPEPHPASGTAGCITTTGADQDGPEPARSTRTSSTPAGSRSARQPLPVRDGHRGPSRSRSSRATPQAPLADPVHLPGAGPVRVQHRPQRRRHAGDPAHSRRQARVRRPVLSWHVGLRPQPVDRPADAEVRYGRLHLRERQR
jgi:hypothetical protein